MHTLGSLFSGIGGFETGFESAGFVTRWQCEIDPHARSVLKRHWPDVPCYEDVTTLDGRAIDPVDIVTFGSPCQDLSVAGRRGGLAGERSGLFHEAVRLIAEMREATNGRYPTLAVWENVVGAFSSNAGRDFAAVLDSLGDCGAVDIGWRVLDAQHFGVPQRRRRIFLVADFRGHRAGEILALAESSTGDTPPRRTSGQDPAARAVAGVGAAGLDSVAKPLGCHKEGGQRNDLDNDTFVVQVASTLGAAATYDRGDGSDNKVVASLNGDRVDNAITAKLAKGTGGPSGDEGNHLIVAPVDFVNVTSQANRTRVEFGSPANTLHQGGQSVVFQQNTRDEVRLMGGDGQVAGALMAEPGMKQQNFLAVPIREAWGMSDDYLPPNAGIGEPGDPMATLRGHKQHAVGLATGIRRLLPVECERLQGFEDCWTAYSADGKPIADTHRYRMLGNSVAVPVIAWIARNVRRAMAVPA